MIGEEGCHHLVVHRETVHRENRVAQALQFQEDLVVDARIVVVGSPEDHDAQALLILQPVQHRRPPSPEVMVVRREGRHAGLDGTSILASRQLEPRSEVGEQLATQQRRVGEIQQRVQVVHTLLGKDESRSAGRRIGPGAA